MTHEDYMHIALEQAEKAAASGEIPIGAVLLSNRGDILAAARNASVTLDDPTAHAEIMALRQAAAVTGNYRLTGTTLYVTVEPCCMCAGAIVHARIKKLVFGAWDNKTGACGSVYDIVRDARLNHMVEVIPGICSRQCGNIIKNFFSARR